MLQAHEPYGAPYDAAMITPQPPRWPRTTARIVGTIGLVLLAPFALVMMLGTVLTLVDGSETSSPAVMDYVFMSVTAVLSATLALGLLIAWWREGLGALLIFAGFGLLVLASFGLSLVLTFPAPFVGALYLLSWALHRTGDTGSGNLDRFSRWIRQSYYGQRTETF